MGLAFYGRSFTLSDPLCNTPGCPVRGGGNPGKCTDTPGILSNAEIREILEQNNLQLTLDQAAGVKYMSWGGDQWVSYDDADTLKIKMDFANQLGLGGTSKLTHARPEEAEIGRAALTSRLASVVWALDLDNADSPSAQYLRSRARMAESNELNLQKNAANQHQAIARPLAYWTPCMTEQERRNLGCPGGVSLLPRPRWYPCRMTANVWTSVPGYHELLVGHGKVYNADTASEVDGCHGSLNRILCLSNEVVERNCNWNRNTDGVRKIHCCDLK